MSEDSPKTTTVRSPWVRLPALILFVVVLDVAEFVVVLVMVVQFVLHLFTSKANANLKNVGANLARYAVQVIAFLTYQSDTLPYPFSPWPAEAKPPAPKPAPAKPKAPPRAKK